jgi:hypothetical protein
MTRWKAWPSAAAAVDRALEGFWAGEIVAPEQTGTAADQPAGRSS